MSAYKTITILVLDCCCLFFVDVILDVMSIWLWLIYTSIEWYNDDHRDDDESHWNWPLKHIHFSLCGKTKKVISFSLIMMIIIIFISCLFVCFSFSPQKHRMRSTKNQNHLLSLFQDEFLFYGHNNNDGQPSNQCSLHIHTDCNRPGCFFFLSL